MEWAQPSVRGGESALLNMEAIDDLSGVASLVGRVWSGSGSASTTFSASTSGGETSWFSSQVRFPEQAENGLWHVALLRLTDNANNAVNLRWSGPGDPGTASIQVISEKPDGEPPVIHAVHIRNRAVEPGTPVEVEVIVTDDASGVANVTGSVRSASGSASLPLFAGASETDTWLATVALPEEAECGEWRIASIQAADKAGNRTLAAADRDLVEDQTFFVSFGGECDSHPPTLSSITVSPGTVNNSESSIVTISAFVDDVGSGVASVSGTFSPDELQEPPRINFTLRRDESLASHWSGEITVPRYSATGRWSIHHLRISDEARNQRIYSRNKDPELANAWFVVQ